MNMVTILESIANNGPVVVVLAWFMWQHMGLVKQEIITNKALQEMIRTNTAALTRVHEVIDHCEKNRS